MIAKIWLSPDPSGGNSGMHGKMCNHERKDFIVVGPGDHTDEILKVVLKCDHHECIATIKKQVENDGSVSDEAEKIFSELRNEILSWTGKTYEWVYDYVQAKAML